MGMKANALLAVILSVASPRCFADDAYPSRPVTLIIHSAAGGPIDILNRLISARVSEILKQPIVLEFRPGGGTIVGATAVANATPNGYSIGFLGSAVPAIQALGKPVMFDVRKYVPIGRFANLPMAAMVGSTSTVRSLPELIALARDKPGRLKFGSTGYGSAPHLAMELLMRATGTQFTHVPYTSGAIAMQDLIAGRIDVLVDAASQAVPLHQAGEVRILAMSSLQRNRVLPDVPTFKELDLDAAAYQGWGAWVGPLGMRQDQAQVVSAALLEASRDESVRKRFEDLGAEAMDVGPKELGHFIDSEFEKFRKLGHDTGLKID